MRALTKLNLGCGAKRKQGYLGVDRYPGAAVDVVCDISRPLPFASSSVDEVLLDNVIEHIVDIAALTRELVRVAVDGCRVHIVTPHFSSQASWRDPTHIHHLSYFSPDHFERRWLAAYTGHSLHVAGKHLRFRGPLGWVGRLIFSIRPKLWEREFCFLFRARTLTFDLVVTKRPAGAGGLP